MVVSEVLLNASALFTHGNVRIAPRLDRFRAERDRHLDRLLWQPFIPDGREGA